MAAAYFGGKMPFRASKHRDDFPDSFIWETALDLAAEHDGLVVVSSDKRLHSAADQHERMTAYESLDDFVEDDDCQDVLADLTPEVVAQNVERIKRLLPNTTESLQANLDADLVEELAWKTVRHGAIPEDNNEAAIVSVGAAENVDFAFGETDRFSDADIGIPFTATVECELNYTIYKGDYYTLSEPEEVNIEEWSDHYFDAHQTFTISIAGHLNLMIDPAALEDENLTDDELEDIITEADHSTDVNERTVHVPEY